MDPDMYEEARGAHAAGQLDVAEAAYRQVLEQQPKHADAAHMLSALMVQRHGDARRDEALVLLQRAISLRPGDGRFRHSLGVMYQASGRMHDAVDAFERANEKEPMSVQILLSLGKALRNVRRHTRAAEVYRSVTLLEPEHPRAHYRRATCLREAGRRKDAITALRQHLRLFPDDEQARFWLAAVTGDVASAQSMPHDLVARLFDQYAATFDQHLVQSLQYHTPEALMDAIKAAAGPNCSACWDRCVDLGCGTGLMGPLLRPHVRVLEGCDLSSGMVDKARARGCYDALAVADLVTHLHCGERAAALDGKRRESSDGGASGDTDGVGNGVCGGDGCGGGSSASASVAAGVDTGGARTPQCQYDLLVAADVFVYIGDLSPVMAAAARRSCDRALFAFSAESLEDREECGRSETASGTDTCSVPDAATGYTLAQSGRYAHSRAYIEAVARQHGWVVVHARNSVIRCNAGKPVHGHLCVFSRGGA